MFSEALAQALVYLEHGNDEGVEVEGWDPVLHRDIWHANILLAHDSDNSSGYPRVQLADFGSAVTREDYATKNVPALRQQWHFRLRGGTVTGPGEGDLREDVSQDGLVIVALSRITMQPRGYRDEFANRPAGKGYSKELTEVLAGCLELEVENRPSARVLLDRVRAKRVKVEGDTGVRLWEGYVDEQGELAKREVVVTEM